MTIVITHLFLRRIVLLLSLSSPLQHLHLCLCTPLIVLFFLNISSLLACTEDEVKERKKKKTFNPSFIFFLPFLKMVFVELPGAPPVSLTAATTDRSFHGERVWNLTGPIHELPAIRLRSCYIIRGNAVTGECKLFSGGRGETTAQGHRGEQIKSTRGNVHCYTVRGALVHLKDVPLPRGHVSLWGIKV